MAAVKTIKKTKAKVKKETSAELVARRTAAKAVEADMALLLQVLELCKGNISNACTAGCGQLEQDGVRQLYKIFNMNIIKPVFYLFIL